MSDQAACPVPWAHALDAFADYGDWGITWWAEEFEGWSASLHDISACSCHAPDDLRCPNFCADPRNLTREQADALIALNLATVLDTPDGPS